MTIFLLPLFKNRASIYESYGKPSKGGLEVLARVYVGVANLVTGKTASNTYRVKRIIRVINLKINQLYVKIKIKICIAFWLQSKK